MRAFDQDDGSEPRTASGAAPSVAPGAPAGQRAPSPAALLALQRQAGNRAALAAIGTSRQLSRVRVSAAPRDGRRRLQRLYSFWTMIGRSWIDQLPAGADRVTRHLESLGSTSRDDAAAGFCRAATDEELRRIAADPGGRAFLMRLVRELQEGWTTGSEATHMQRLVAVIGTSAPTVVASSGGRTIEIEVITFESGSAALDWAGEAVLGEGYRGHTALIVGGDVYSFELGWQVGESRASYMRKNRHREAHGQVLRLPVEDARKIQRWLARQANQGIYGWDGLCSDQASEALAEGLAGLGRGGSPQHVRRAVAATGRVVETRHYPARSTTPQ